MQIAHFSQFKSIFTLTKQSYEKILRFFPKDPVDFAGWSDEPQNLWKKKTKNIHS